MAEPLAVIQADSAAAALQHVLGVIESRTHKPLDTFERYRPSDGQLNALIARLREAEDNSNTPLKVVYEKDKVFDNWLLGTYERGEHNGQPAEWGDIWVTTDRVHASEVRGDAKDDAEAWVTMRNNLPIIIAGLEELLARRGKHG